MHWILFPFARTSALMSTLWRALRWLESPLEYHIKKLSRSQSYFIKFVTFFLCHSHSLHAEPVLPVRSFFSHLFLWVISLPLIFPEMSILDIIYNTPRVDHFTECSLTHSQLPVKTETPADLLISLLSYSYDSLVINCQALFLTSSFSSKKYSYFLGFILTLPLHSVVNSS